MLLKVCFIYFFLAFAGLLKVVKAQTGAFSPDSFMLSLLSYNERFLANAVCVKAGRTLPCKELSSLLFRRNIDSSRTTFNLDSVQWTFTMADVQCSVSFPNDISLVSGMDRKELIEVLVQSLAVNKIPIKTDCDTITDVSFRIIQVVQEELMGVLQRVEFLVSPDSVPLCSRAYPLESMVTELQRKEGCGCVPPIIVAVHGYGQRVDTIATSLSALLDACDIAQMEAWSALEDGAFTALLRHRFLGYNHMFFVRKTHNRDAWLVDVYPFIPRHNVLNLFKDHVVKGRAEKLRIE